MTLAELVLVVGARAADAQAPASRTALAEAIESVASRIFQRGASPGLGVVAVRDTQIIYMKGFGYADLEARRPVTPDTEFYIASATKAFTGLAVAVLDLDGVIELDSAIGHYLPALPLRPPLDADSISVRSLLTHTHGISDGIVSERLSHSGDYRDDAELIRLLTQHEPNPRGRAFTYGNIGYNIVSFAMNAVLRESWKGTLHRLVFAPLGMSRTSAYVTGRSADVVARGYVRTRRGFERARERKRDATMHAAGGVITTARDMAAWLEVQISGGLLDRRRVVPAAAIAETQRPTVPLMGRTRGIQNVGYGLGWQTGILDGDTLLWHGGAFPGFAIHMSLMPRQRLGVAVMANEGTAGRELTDAMAYAIYDVLRRSLVRTR